MSAHGAPDLSSSEIEDLRKIKMTREVIDRVVGELKSRFWIITILVLLGGYFGASKYVDDVAKSQIDKTKTEAIVELLARDSGFRTLVTAQALPGQSFTTEGQHIPCTEAWNPPNAISRAICPQDSLLLGGGCSMTCLSMRHLETIPVSSAGSAVPPINAWQCRHAPAQDDPFYAQDKANGRTFHAVALCLKIK